MKTRVLGRNGPVVSALGLGCMGMSAFYGGRGDDAASIAVIHRALERGVTLLDTADMYGPHTNEVLVGKAIADRRAQVFLATKFGVRLDPNDPQARGVDGRPEYVQAACEASLQRLGVDHIDLYYQHRVDPQVPIEDTVGAMKAGAVGVGLLLIGVHQKFLGYGGRLQARSREMVALVTQDAHPFRGQRIVQQLDDVFTVGTEVRHHRPFVQAALGSIQALLIQGQLGRFCFRHRGFLYGHLLWAGVWCLHTVCETSPT